MSTRRQLAAIMFTDIAGYTVLMGKNTQKALELVHISKELQKSLVQKYRGKWIKEMGDGTLAQFGSALDAVNCAVEIQEQARAKFDGKLRIGIHSGDITIEDGDVFGDGVNVASRLESIADPGGIYISDAIWKAIRGQTDIQAKYLGEIPLKNVSYEVRTYAVQGVGFPIPATAVRKPADISALRRRFHLWAGFGAVLVLILLAFYLYSKQFGIEPVYTMNSDKISIAVLPFRNFSGDPTHEPFCDGMTNEVIDKLTKLTGISKVTSLTSALSYKGTQKTMPEIAAELDVTHILEANFQKSGDQIKIALQLIDGPSDKLNWSDQYMGDWGNIFDIQAAVAENVARKMGAEISSNEMTLLRKQPTKDKIAYEHFLRAQFYHYQFWKFRESTDIDFAIQFYQKAIDADPEFAAALSHLASAMEVRHFVTLPANEELKDSIHALFQKAISIDPDLDIAQRFYGFFNFYILRNATAAFNNFRKAINLNPKSQDNYSALVNYYIRRNIIEGMSSDLDSALIISTQALNQEPEIFHLQLLFDISGAFFGMGNLSVSELIIDKALSIEPDRIDILNQKFHLRMLQHRFEEMYDIALHSNRIRGNNQGLNIIGKALLLQGKFVEAEKAYRDFYNLPAHISSTQDHERHAYAYVLRKLGKESEALQQIELSRRAIENYMDNEPYDLAKIHAFRGEHNLALDLLEQFKPWWGLHLWIAHDPLFENLRGEARFKDIVEKSGSYGDSVKQVTQHRMDSGLYPSRELILK